MSYTAPAGWYPDPTDQRVLRWWDGTAWTHHAATQPVPAAVHLEDEERAARWARAALLAAVAAQVVGGVIFRSQARRVFDEVTSDTSGLGPDVWGRWPALVMQLTSAVEVVAGVLFLVWFFRSATNASALGLPARRSPAAGVAGFMLPVVNLWWPYQSTRDLFPDDRRRRLVLRWFLLWVVGGIVGSVVLLVAVFVDSWVGWALLVVPAVLTTLAGLAARAVIGEALAVHAEIDSARASGAYRSGWGTTDAGYRYAPPQWPPAATSEPARSNNLAVAALACGIGSLILFFFPLPAVAAVPLGIVGHRRARDLAGEVMAAVAIALGVVVLVVFAISLAASVVESTDAPSVGSITLTSSALVARPTERPHNDEAHYRGSRRLGLRSSRDPVRVRVRHKLARRAGTATSSTPPNLRDSGRAGAAARCSRGSLAGPTAIRRYGRSAGLVSRTGPRCRPAAAGRRSSRSIPRRTPGA